MGINKIKVEDMDTFLALYNNSALTKEGLAEKSIPDFQTWITNLTPMKTDDFYIISGKFMNDHLHLTGDNAYPDDLTIVSVKLDDLEDFNKVVIPRFQVGCRWLDDVVNNNLSREGLKPMDIEGFQYTGEVERSDDEDEPER